MPSKQVGSATACRSHESMDFGGTWAFTRHEHLALAHRNAKCGLNKLACSITSPAPLPSKRPVQTKHLVTIVFKVGHQHFIPIHNHSERISELPLSRSLYAYWPLWEPFLDAFSIAISMKWSAAPSQCPHETHGNCTGCTCFHIVSAQCPELDRNISWAEAQCVSV